MLPVGSMKFLNDRFTLIGNSRSAEATSFFIPELGITLDGGFIVTSTKFYHLFITHGHGDHSFRIPLMYSASSTSPLNIYVPALSVDYFEKFLSSAQLLNDQDEEKSRENCKKRFQLHPVSQGEKIEIDKNLSAEVFNCSHTVPCVGYGFFEKRTKLRSDFVGLNGKQIQELKKQNVSVTEEIFHPLFAFFGDTTPEVFVKTTLWRQMPVVICECTFLDGEQSDDKGHTHWSGLRPIVEENPHITFILIHFSLKHKREEIFRFFRDQPLKNIKPFVF